MNYHRIEVSCGRGTVPVHVPDRNLVKVIRSRPWSGLSSPSDAVVNALMLPMGTPPLLDLARGRKNAVVVISDITRPVPNSIILPPILRTLEASGIDREKILILIATGMHRPNKGVELTELVGEEVASAYRIVRWTP